MEKERCLAGLPSKENKSDAPHTTVLHFILFSKCHFLFLNIDGTPTGWKTRGGSLGPGIVKGRRPIKEIKCNETFSRWNTHDLVKVRETTVIPLSRASWIAFVRRFCFFWHTPEIKSAQKAETCNGEGCPIIWQIYERHLTDLWLLHTIKYGRMRNNGVYIKLSTAYIALVWQKEGIVLSKKCQMLTFNSYLDTKTNNSPVVQNFFRWVIRYQHRTSPNDTNTLSSRKVTRM